MFVNFIICFMDKERGTWKQNREKNKVILTYSTMQITHMVSWVHVYIHTYICTNSCMYISYVHVYIHTYIHIYICAYVRIHACMHVRSHEHKNKYLTNFRMENSYNSKSKETAQHKNFTINNSIIDSNKYPIMGYPFPLNNKQTHKLQKLLTSQN